MSLLADKYLQIHASWSTDEELSGDDGAEHVLLSPSVWQFLGIALSERRVCISLLPGGSSAARHRPLVSWAELSMEVDSSDFVQIPLTWVDKYPQTFASDSSSRKVSVALTKACALTSVIIALDSAESYAKAEKQPELLENLLFNNQPILRQGDKRTVSSNSGSLTVKVEVCEPILQGYAAKDSTKIIVALRSDQQLDVSSPSSSTDDGSSADAFEIDEKFLESSILTQALDSNTGSPTGRSNQGEDISLTCSCHSLPSPRDLGRDDSTAYIRTNNLGRLGVLNGDWGIVSTTPSKYRLVRIVADDTLPDERNGIWLSPGLRYNILGDDLSNISSAPAISVRPSPFGCSNPVIPTAKSITVARVASPIAINKRYQNTYLQHLKRFFDEEKRLVKEGDILFIPLDTDNARWPSGQTDEVGGESENVEHPLSKRRFNEVVFFKITNVEYDVVPNGNHATQDLYTGSTLGELGCWVDSSITRVVQTGVEHSRVPDVKAYLDLDGGSPSILARLSNRSTSKLLHPSSTFSKLLTLSAAALDQPAVDYELNMAFILKGARGIGKFTAAAWVAQRLGIHLLEVNCYDVIGDTDVKTEATLRVRFEQATNCTPCVMLLRHLEAFSQSTQASEPQKESPVVIAVRECLGDVQRAWKETGYPVIVMGTTSEPGRVPPSLSACFKQELNFEAPNEGERYEMLESLLESDTLGADVSLQHLATQTAALLAGDLHDLVVRARGASIERVLKQSTTGLDLLGQTVLLAQDFEVALGLVRESYSESIGAPKIPTVSWDDVGGLAHVKSDILDTIQLPLDHPELFADGLKKRSGILLYGPPGTGKTLIAKAVATSCSLNFFSVKGPELLNMYIGESEANVRRVFQRARDAKPCVIFFDELDSVAPKRGNHGDSGGVMDRIVSQLLAELDGMSGGKDGADVFVIGATNRPDLLDPALLRPGRFDRMLYLGVSDTHEAQLNILEALTRKFRLDPELQLRDVAERCPFNYTGADFYALCSDAMLNAMSRKAEEIDEEIAKLNAREDRKHVHDITPQYYLSEMATPEQIIVYVSKADFDLALDNLVPSVSQTEMDHYREVQKRFSQPGKEEED